MAQVTLNDKLGFVDSSRSELPPRKPPSMKKPFRQSLVVSFSFMFVFAAYLSIQNLQSSLNHEQGLGVTSLACLYGAIILSGTLSPSVIRLIGAKRSLVLAWICHILYTATNFYPHWLTLIPSSILLGFSSGPMWTSQGLYLTSCGEAYAFDQGKSLYGILSTLNSIFFTCYESTDLFGNIISSVILTRSSYNETFFNSSRTCGALSSPDVSSNATMAVTDPVKHIVYTLLSVFLVFDIAGLALTAVYLKPLEKRGEVEDRKGLLQSVVSCFTALKDIRLLLVIPLFMATAMSQGILFTAYTKSYISCALGIYNVGYIMASHGLVTAITALLMGRVAKYTGRIVQLVVAVALNMGMLLMMLFWNPLNQPYAMFFIIPVGYGMSEGILRMQFNSFIGMVFFKAADSAFANYHTWNAVAFTLTFTAGMFLTLTTLLYIAIGLMALGFTGYIITELLIRKQTTSETRVP
ncbi:protein unc-93 homolog A-like [Gigantopelta aegis]|uniref:protein unc-93 homolog A-like n=1 Tax=Gigantopelta aegis TaxID=1735272 RepID=UPI001B88C178|nr:protein unc-93 homolog A-like [Gigantopelta aegis]XP_041348888.1 protein unc-93 homolog A-like [Gigantopelta aegis]